MANGKVLEITGFEELLRDLDDAGHIKDKLWFPVRDAISQIVQQIEARAKENLAANDSAASGQLRASVGSEVRITDEAIEGVVGSNSPYAPFVEFGTGPAVGHPAYTPPSSIADPGQPLYEWVRLKGLAGVYSLKSGRRLGGKARQIDENRQVARAVWAHIRRHGTRPHPFFYPAWDELAEDAQRLIEAAVDQVIADFNAGRP